MGMYLSELLSDYHAMSEIPKIWISDIAYRVRDICEEGTTFFHFEAYLDNHNWNERICNAIKKGAKVLVLDASDPYYDYQEIEKEYAGKIRIVTILNLHKNISQIAAKFFNYPQNNLRVISVTGTNGKTSVAHIIAQTLNNLGFKAAIIGSVGYGIISKPLIMEPLTGFRVGHTTPPAIQTFKILSNFVSQKVDVVVIEVTSHALVWNTISAIFSEAAIFTNISDDHLEYHGNMLNYINSKKELFNSNGSHVANSYIINSDDIVGRSIIRELSALGKRVITYGLSDDNNNNQEHVYVKDVFHKLSGMDLTLKYKNYEVEITTPFLGSFYIHNILAVFGVLLALRIPLSKMEQAFSYIVKVPGRMEVFSGENLPITVVDFAHNPDGIEKCLRSIKNNTALRKIHVVCGASDVTTDLSNKKIAKIISKFADKIILTVLSSIYVSDNNIIIKSFRSTFGKDNNIVSIINRKAAIEYAIKDANHDDVVVILGKGVQNYILEAGKMTPHNDVECVDSIYSDEVSKSTNLVSVLSKKFHEYKEKIAIYHHQNKITFKELDQLSSSYANRLKSLNISQGDNVGVCLERSIEATAILIACIKIGAVYVPLDPQNYELHSMKLIQEHYKPQIIIYSEDFNFKGLENCYSLEFFVNSNFTGTFTHKIKIPEDKPFCILYTSGSTSDPKGVVRTYKAILNQINYFIKIHDENLVLGQVFSLRHVASIIQIFGVFCVGGSIVIIDDDEKKIPEKLIEICNTYKITRLGFSPERYKSFLDKIDEKKLKLNTVKEISCTGDYLSNNIVMKSIQLLPQVELINSYGSTETGGIARQICTKDLSKELVPYPGVKIKILDENNSLLLENETGEIAVSGSSVGYYHNNDTVSFIEISSKIYFKTGDLGYLNDNGNLIILGRNKFTIKVKGRKIFLRDINKNFTSSVLLKGSVVTEVEMGNRNLLVMFYIPSSEENLEGKLKKIAEDFLPLECRPKVYIAIDEIPYLDSGKIDYKTLQKQYLDDIKAQQQ